jgi:penicillin-binding protein 1C
MKTLRLHFKTILKILAGLSIAFAVFIYFFVFYGLPDVRDIERGFALPSTRIYDRNGILLYEILPPEQGRNRVVPLEEMPQQCINAVIATEDANYWSHPGVDPVGIARAIWINVRGGQVLAGGSTITQQTARILLLDFGERAERSVRRKLREMVLAVQLQQQTSKEHVLALYLNQVYFGNLAYGIEAAAQTYFHKDTTQLSTAECALLAGLIQNPVYYDPLSNLENAKARQAIVLNLMVQRAYLTEADANSSKQDELQFGSTRFPIEAPHFVMAVWTQLERDYPEQLYSGGLDVMTTVDLNWQRAAEEIVNLQLNYLNHPVNNQGIPANANNAAVVALDPYTGEVLTMLGSPDYFDEAIDGAVNAALAPRQPGSTLKPFTYAVGMNPLRENPFTAATVFLDVETPFVTQRLESYTPSNFGQVEHGPVPIRQALGSSYNIPAVLALDEVGIAPFLEFMSNIGLDTLASNPYIDLAITLGGGEVQLLDLAQAYSIFPNGGYRITPTFIRQIATRDGDILYKFEPSPLRNRVLDERVAWLISDILSDNEARIPSFGINSALQIGRPAAAKTGTTTDFRDNWVMGYTPNLVVGVWVGNADNTPMVEVTGVSGAGPIYNQFIRRVTASFPEYEFQRPDGLIRIEVCSLSGLLPKDNCPLRRVEWFIPGTEPTEFDNYYQTFAINRNTGQLADETTAQADIVLETFVVLPQAARDWAIRNGLRLPPADAVIEVGADDDTVYLLEPDPYTTFELSPVLPRENQRLRLTVATPQNTASVTYYLNGQVIGTATESPWVVWWALELGDHELIAEATLTDGTVERSEVLPFRVEDYEPAQSQTILPGQ